MVVFFFKLATFPWVNQTRRLTPKTKSISVEGSSQCEIKCISKDTCVLKRFKGYRYEKMSFLKEKPEGIVTTRALERAVLKPIIIGPPPNPPPIR